MKDRLKPDSIAQASHIVDILLDRFSGYLMLKKVQTLVVPNVIHENLQIYRKCCQTLTMNID